MESDIKNWMTQIRKGYLEICILTLIKNFNKMYGFQIISTLENNSVTVKEGTIYPLLNRMTKDNLLSSSWDLKNVKGNPRKFYSLTSQGVETLKIMQDEYEDMTEILNKIKKGDHNG